MSKEELFAQYQKVIFMGGPDTIAKCKALHKRLDDALDWLSGIQEYNPCLLDLRDFKTHKEITNEICRVQNECSVEILNIVAEIATALGVTVQQRKTKIRFVLRAESKVYHTWPLRRRKRK